MTAPLSITMVADGTLPLPEYRALATALEPHTHSPVRWVDGTLADLDDDGFVVLVTVRDVESALTDAGPERATRLRPRLVISDGSPREALTALEHTATAAALDRLSLLEWSPERGFARGPAGLRSVGEAIGAGCVALFGGDRHCLLESHRHDGLPHLLVDYLREYERRAL